MRPIKLTDNIIHWMVKQLKDTCAGAPVNSDMFKLELPMSYKKDKKYVAPVIILTDIADMKIKALVTACNKEIAWHGLVRRLDENTYEIYDIVVFPQTVTASTAVSNDETYGPWLMQFSDEDFANLRFHGHSHVNMGVTPSIVDTNYQSDIIERTKDFYIFAIYNKKGDYNIWLYDVVNNIMYDKTDIQYKATPIGGVDWAEAQMKEFVTEQKLATATSAAKGKGKTDTTPGDKWWEKNPYYNYGAGYSSAYGNYRGED